MVQRLNDFDQALIWVLADEGGNSDDPHDHGGRTSRGVTQRVYDAWRDEQKMTSRDVYQMSDAECHAIYYEEYWMPYCPQFPNGVDYLFFDHNVNAGLGSAAKILQRALGVADDGHIGPITRQALRNASPRSVIVRMSDARRVFYRSLHQPRFLHGWLNRVDRSEKRALELIS